MTLILDEDDLFVEEVESACAVKPTIMKWEVDSLHELFGLKTKWQDSQLFGVLCGLGLLTSEGQSTAMLRQSSAFVAGGCLVRHLMGTDIFKGDIDIYPSSERNEARLIKYLNTRGFEPNKTKYSHEFEYKMGNRKAKVQIVGRKPQGVASTLKEFDFEHCKIAFDGRTILTAPAALVALAQRKLHLSYVHDPTYTLIRSLKYKQMGFDADLAMGRLAKMINGSMKGVDASNWDDDFKVEY